MRPRRALVALAVPAVVVALAVVDISPDDPEGLSLAAPQRSGPTVAAADEPSATWYCASGTATGDGAAEGTVVVTNSSEEQRELEITAYGDDEQSAEVSESVDAGESISLEVSELLSAERAAVLVEADGGGIFTEHILSGPTGTTAGPCASSASSVWFMPAATTVLGVDTELAIFNPFPDMAVVDIVVETEDGARTPPEFEGLVVPAGSVRAVDISSVVTVREHIAVTVATRSGLVVTEQLEVITDEADLAEGLATSLGAPSPETIWHMPAGPAVGEDVTSHFVVYNPGEEQAEVDVQLLVDDPDQHGFIDPYELSIRPGQFSVLELGEDGRLPDGAGYGALVESRNGAGVVAARVVNSEADPPGRSVGLGTPLVATEWLAPVPEGDEDAAERSELAVMNAGVRTVTVDVRSADGEDLVEMEIEPGARATISPEDIDGDYVVVTASAPVSVGGFWVLGNGIADFAAFPVDGHLTRPEPSAIDPTTSPTVVLDGILPDEEIDEIAPEEETDADADEETDGDNGDENDDADEDDADEDNGDDADEDADNGEDEDGES